MNNTEYEALLAALERFTDRWKALDGEGVAACFENSTRVTIIGTDPGEYTVGVDTYLDGWRRGGYPAKAHEFRWDPEPTMTVDGTIGWAHGTVRYDFVLVNGSRVRGTMWITVVLRNTDDRWRFVHLHASFADQPANVAS